MKAKLYVAAFIALVLLIGGAYVKGRISAKQECEVAQLKANETARKKHDRIKRKAPTDSNKSAAVEWLRDRTR